nr:homocysteine S-methyltransferase family protein [Geothrix terrae]
MRREFLIPADDHLVYGGSIYDAHARTALASIYRSYLQIARSASLPILITTSTRRSNPDRISVSRFANRNIHQDWVAFLREIAADFGDSTYIGCLLGTKGNAYQPQEALPEEEALSFHRTQCQACLEGGAEFLMAGVIPSLSEAKGLARAMGETGLPFIISFIVTRRGCLLDGTPIHEAIDAIDDASTPLCFMVNCVHPDHVRAGLSAGVNRNRPSMRRLIGIQANASTLDPDELDGRAELHCDGSASLSESMLTLRRDHGFQIFGGCCGTDATLLEDLAARLHEPHPPSRP